MKATSKHVIRNILCNVWWHKQGDAGCNSSNPAAPQNHSEEQQAPLLLLISYKRSGEKQIPMGLVSLQKKKKKIWDLTVTFPREWLAGMSLHLTFSQRYGETHRKVTQEPASQRDKTNRFALQVQSCYLSDHANISILWYAKSPAK